MEAHTLFARGRLVVQRRTPRVLEDFSSGCRGRSLGLGGSVPPYGGIPFGDFPSVSDTTLGISPGRGVSAYLQEEPPSLYTGREGHQELPYLFVRPSRFLFARKEGLFCRAPLSASRGRRVSARLQEEPLSLCIEREGRRGFP